MEKEVGKIMTMSTMNNNKQTDERFLFSFHFPLRIEAQLAQYYIVCMCAYARMYRLRITLFFLITLKYQLSLYPLDQLLLLLLLLLFLLLLQCICNVMIIIRRYHLCIMFICSSENETAHIHTQTFALTHKPLLHSIF